MIEQSRIPHTDIRPVLQTTPQGEGQRDDVSECREAGRYSGVNEVNRNMIKSLAEPGPLRTGLCFISIPGLEMRGDVIQNRTSLRVY